MPSNSGLTVKVGIFVVVALIIAVAFSMRSNESGVGKDTYTVKAYFEEAMGLETGADVSLAGVNVGRVSEITFSPQRRAVEVSVAINSKWTLPTDSVAKVESNALLGNSVVTLRYGKEAKMLSDGSEIPTEATANLEDVIDAVASFNTNVEEFLAEFNTNSGNVFKKVEEVIDENRADIREATASAKSFAEIGPKIERVAERLDEITLNVKEGKGTIGKLFQEDTLYNDVRTIADELAAVSTDIKEGRGTLYQLIYDDKLATDAQSAFTSLGEAGDEIKAVINENRENVDRFMADIGDLGPELRKAVDGISQLSDSVRESNGTLGKLINDDSLYNEAKNAFETVNENFENSEEQGVIRSFVGVLFGAMI